MKSPKVLLMTTILCLVIASGWAPISNAQASQANDGWVTDNSVQTGTNNQSIKAESVDVTKLPKTSAPSVADKLAIQQSVPPTDLPVDAATFAQLKTEAGKSSQPASSKSQIFNSLNKAPGLNDFSGTNAPDPDLSFAGPKMGNWYPGDPTIAVGPSYVIVCVNNTVSGFDKTTKALKFNTSMLDWWSSSLRGGYGLVFNPVCKYDVHSGRFIMVAALQNPSPLVSKYLVAVSKNSSIFNWYTYAFDATLDGSKKTSNFAAFPDIGVDNNAVYITSNQYNSSQVFQYSKIRVFQKSALYSGSTPSWTDFYNFTNVTTGKKAFSVRAALSIDSTNKEYFVDSEPTGGSQLAMFRIISYSSWTTPVFSKASYNTPVSTYALQPNAPQAGSTTRIQTGDNRLSNLVLRNGVLYTAHTVHGTTSIAGIQWYEIDPVSATEIQEGSFFDGAGRSYYYPAVTVDAQSVSSDHEVGITFDYSGPTDYPSNGFTGRVEGVDPDGTVQIPNYYFSGTRANISGRWGSYSGAAMDPTSGSFDLWFVGLLPGTTTKSWATTVYKAHFLP